MAKRGRRANEREHAEYMSDVKDYLGKVERGRSIRRVDPNQPALSEEAETIRQTDKLDESNKFFGKGRYQRMNDERRK